MRNQILGAEFKIVGLIILCLCRDLSYKELERDSISDNRRVITFIFDETLNMGQSVFLINFSE